MNHVNIHLYCSPCHSRFALKLKVEGNSETLPLSYMQSLGLSGGLINPVSLTDGPLPVNVVVVQ